MQGVVRWFVGHGERPLVPPARLREYAPLEDDPDGGYHFKDRSIHGVAFALEYCNSRGWASTRTIRCLAVDPVHPAAISAFCHVQQAVRTFRLDRIISIGDLRTGRILSGDEQELLLAPYLPRHYARREFAELFALQDVARDGVFALLQLAMPDGKLTDEARDVVLDYVEVEAQDSGCRLPPEDHVELWIDNLSPPLQAVIDSVTALLSDKEKFARLLPWLLKADRCHDSSPERDVTMRMLIAAVRRHFRDRPSDRPRDVRRRALGDL